MENIKILTTEDGSSTLVNTALNETYHSLHGAVTESQHVFIDNGLDYVAQRCADIPIRIFEMGFGTGLNALLTYKLVNQIARTIEYHSLEAFPLETGLISRLNFFLNPADQDQLLQMHSLEWNVSHQLTDRFSLKKISGKIEDHVPKESYFHLVYYDAFAPNKQAEVWTLDVLKRVLNSLGEGGVFVTYCAKGQLKRDLKALGCEVQTLPGPPGKKEMVRAVKMNRHC